MRMREWTLEYNDDIVYTIKSDNKIRPLFFTTFGLFIINSNDRKNLFDYFIYYLSFPILIMYFCVDMVILPFKILMTFEVKK